MTWTLGIATYFIVWWMTLFAVLPIGLRTQGEDGEVVPGTPESAPANVRIVRIFALNTAVSLVVFAGIWLLLRSQILTLEGLRLPGMP